MAPSFRALAAGVAWLCWPPSAGGKPRACLRSAASPCSPGAERAAAPYFRIGPRISKRAEKDQRRLPAKHRRQIAVKIVQLRSAPTPPDSKKLTGYPYRRVDVGEYRVIYRVEREMLEILRIGKRNDAEVYRNLR